MASIDTTTWPFLKTLSGEGENTCPRIILQEPVWFGHWDKRFCLPSFRAEDGLQGKSKSSEDRTSDPGDLPRLDPAVLSGVARKLVPCHTEDQFKQGK